MNAKIVDKRTCSSRNHPRKHKVETIVNKLVKLAPIRLTGRTL